MIKKVVTLPLLYLVILFSSCKKEDHYPEITGKKFETNFGSTFELKIALPKNYNENKEYKAIFLLDAEWMLSECKQAMAKHSNNSDYIIFGLAYLGNNNRTNDFTPSNTAGETGKAELLKQLIETDIFKNYIRVEFPNISLKRENTTFIGHSLGGLFGTYLFLKNSPAFGNYLLISSSYTYDSEKIFGIELEERQNIKHQSAKIYFGTGTQEELGFHSTLQHFHKILDTHYPNVKYKSETYRNTEHTDARAKALQNGLPYLIES